MSFARYPSYKDSCMEWLGQIPAHWAVKRLKQACHVFPSNVDKKSHDGETPVLLCNYTDVYYNETITAGQGFMAAISWKRAGNSARRAARAMVTVPLSSGWRKASSAARGNSGSSSRNSTPWCAREISPGRGGEPPPTSAIALDV